MEKVAEKRDKEMRPGFVLSIVLHVLFVAIFLLPLLPAPPQAKSEDSVNVELVPQQEEKQEVATKANEKPDQPPKPTQKPDENPAQQTAENKDEPQQPEGKKSDEQPPKQADPKGKEAAEKPAAKSAEAKADKPDEQAEKPAPKADDASADKPVEKAGQQPSATETPLPDMKGDQKDATTTQQAEAQPTDTPPTPPNDAAAEQQAEAQAAAAAQAQAEAQAAQQQADAKDQQANVAKPPPSDATAKASSSAPDVLTTNEPSESQVQQPQAPSTDQNDPQAQQTAQAPTADPQQSAAEQPKDQAIAPQIALPAVRPSPAPQSSQSQSASSSQGGSAGGAALVTEPQPPKSLAPKRAIQAKKLYSGAEMARLSKSDYDAWKKMPRRQRVLYLCRSEEKLQFGYDLRATSFINSALSPAMISDTSLVGDGVVVDTPKGFQRVALTCQVDSDALKVTAFSYTVRGHVSPSQVDKLGFVGN